MIPAEVLRQVRRVQLRARRAVNSLVGGEYHSAFQGSGLNFEDVREYQPGDDVRRIDWNVTARLGKPFLKRFVEDRELTILLAVDLSGSLNFGSTATTKRTVAAEIAALLAFAAISNGDRVGFLAFTDRIERYLPPQRGSRHVVRLLRDVLHLNPQSRGTNLQQALLEINRIQRRRAVVFVLSDFQADGYQTAFRQAAARHDLIAVRIGDPLETDWPNIGTIEVADAETGQTLRLRSQTLIDAGAAVECDRQFKLLLKSAEAEGIEVSTRGGHFEAVVRFLRQRERRRAG